MSKAYTAIEFNEQITSDRNWRIREIGDLRSAVFRADKVLRPVLLRAAVCICYAHWEGYVCFVARKYFEHISLRKFQYRNLERQFVRNYFLPRLTALSSAKIDMEGMCRLIDDILDSGTKRFAYANDDLVNAGGNLNSDKLRNICILCGVEPEAFSDDKSFIDVVMLKRRNAIAHGEETLIEQDDLPEISSKVITLMREFGNQVDNCVQLESYKVV